MQNRILEKWKKKEVERREVENSRRGERGRGENLQACPFTPLILNLPDPLISLIPSRVSETTTTTMINGRTRVKIIKNRKYSIKVS